MNKTVLGPKTLIYPMPVLLVGANVNDRPNFMAVAWSGIACDEPPMISVAIRHRRHTLKGLRQNQTFSVNVPTSDMAAEADYCGIVSGAKADKVKACKFNIFYGKINTAPLIEQCPINLECKVVHVLDLGSHSLVIGRIEETWVSDDCLTDGKPDIDKIKPFAYIPSLTTQYHKIGEVIGKAYSIGKKLEQRNDRIPK